MKKIGIFAFSLALLGCGENQNSSQTTQPSQLQMVNRNEHQTCQYNFDATQEDYDKLWNNENPDYLIGSFRNIEGQKFTLKVAPPYFSNNDPDYGTFYYLRSLATNKTMFYSAKDSMYFPYLQDALGDFNLPTTGILAIEMQLDIPNSPLNGGYYGEPGSSYTTGIGFNSLTENEYIIRSGYNFIAGGADPEFGENPPSLTYNFDSERNDGTDYKSIVSFHSKMDEYREKQHRLGVYINQDTKQVGFIVNGVDQGYQGVLPAPLKNIGFDIRSSVVSDKEGTFSDKLAGLEFSSELITDRKALQFDYPKGTTDICGNAI